MPHPPIKLSISKVVFGGDGLAELNGKAVFVEGALPGETVEAEIIEQKKNFARAKILRVLEPSPNRVAPACPYTSHCGGCQYQHVSYAEELRLKEGQLKEIVSHAGLEAVVRPIVASEKEFGYRSSITLHPVSAKSRSSTRLGLFGRDNSTVIPVKNCLLADPSFEPYFLIEMKAGKCPERVTFKLDESGRIVDDLKENFLRMRLAGQTFIVHSGGFFQTNLAIASRIAERIGREVAAYKPDALFDLFAGVGTFGLASASFCGSVIFIEEGAQALQALGMNLAERALRNTHVVPGRVEKTFLRAWREYGKDRSMILVDPPRAGLEGSLASALAGLDAKKMVYLSCDPVTLERDLRLICAGGWKVESLEPFDMFPRTKHLETLAILCRV